MTFLPLLEREDLAVVNAYPLVAAHALIDRNRALYELYSHIGGRQSSGKDLPGSYDYWLILTIYSISSCKWLKIREYSMGLGL